MKVIKILATSIFAVAMFCLVASCDDDDNKLSGKVMVSDNVLEFDVAGGTQTITVYADEDWLSEVPDWITLSPSSGNRVTEVTVTVGGNYVNGEPDEPRSGTVLFKGRNLDSQSTMRVDQDGDKYRNVQSYTLSQLSGLSNSTPVSVSSVVVSDVFDEGFMVTDGTTFIYVVSTDAVTAGDKLTILAEKSTENDLPTLEMDSFTTESTGNSVTYPTATDITGQIDSYTSSAWDYVCVTGTLSISSGDYIISVEDMTYSVYLAQYEGDDASSLDGHSVTLTGFYAGLTAPYIRIYGVELKDNE